MNPILKGFTAAVRPPDRRKAWEWCEDHVVVDNMSPMPGRWRSDSSPWVKELMEIFPDNRVSDISVMCSAQSSKTQTLLNCSCWAISEDPGPAMWVMAAKDEAKTFVRDRVKPTFENCQPVADALLSAEIFEFTFNSMPFYFTGAGSPSKLMSKPIRWLFLDEVRNYPPGALDIVLKRTRAFWNSRRVLISTPDAKDDAVHRAFLAGDQRVFHFACPCCHQVQPLKFEQLKAQHPQTKLPCKFSDVPGARNERGQWNFDLLAEHLRYQCVACGHLIADTPAERKSIARNGRFVRMNPNAPRHRVSFHWNALLPPWVSWRSIVEEFINARAAARCGDLAPLKTFVNETLGEPWDDQLGQIDDYDFLELRKSDYDFGDVWPEEIVRFMAADKQESGGEHYWYVIRAFGARGKSRLVTYGRCNTKDELEQIRRENNVRASNAMIDSGFKAREVYRFCLATGWKAFKGDDAEYFLHTNKKTGKAVRRLWIRNFVDPHFGSNLQGRLKPIPLFRWSNNGAKDLLTEQMMGLVGDWTLPRQVEPLYLKQVTAERREEKVDAKGRISYFWKQIRRDNHLRDCELMILVAAIITKVIQTKVGIVVV
jgi:phage terminase large subunit GpA-like protein